MIPLTCETKELKICKDIVVDEADKLIAAAGSNMEYEVGTMIEIPRAALTADEIAEQAEFFCFGTNDLTQMTFGFSRDDAGKFLGSYYETKIFENDPFAKLDRNGVGKLMETAVKLGKSTRPDLHCGICGEHGGDPYSVEFCHQIGLDYVSCSPFRVPIARLAAAQAAIMYPKDEKAASREAAKQKYVEFAEKAFEYAQKAQDSASAASDDVKASIKAVNVGWEAAKAAYKAAKNNK